MRIGVDARELAGRPTGVGRYLSELLRRWIADPATTGARITAFTPDAAVAHAWTHQGPGATLEWRVVEGPAGALWEQRRLAAAVRRTPLDVYFAPAYTAPLWLGRVPVVLSMHDVSFAAHPEWYGWRHGLRLRLLARASAQRARLVLTLTRFCAREIAAHLRVPDERVRVIPLAVDYLGSSPPDRRATFEPRVLYVGSIFERRHLPLLIDGVARARQVIPDVSLDVIGENRTQPPIDLAALARRRGLAAAVRLRDYVSDDELTEAYATAGVFAFLSEYEGFGLTPLEAMRAGLPVIVLDTPVAREVYGEGARYVARGDAAGVAAAIRDLLEFPQRMAQQRAGDATVARYTWADTAHCTWRALQDAATMGAP